MEAKSIKRKELKSINILLEIDGQSKQQNRKHKDQRGFHTHAQKQGRLGLENGTE